ncbi:MAG: TonB-dependent receptor [Xanthomonadales bacterium]|nr:TonB-dependent receptor [Xanthomonadales bacterium]
MSNNKLLLTVIAVAALLCFQTTEAQAPPVDPVSFNFDGGIAIQTSSDLKDSNGSFSANRWFVSMGVTYAWDYRNSIGLSAGGGITKYDFDEETGFGGGMPWEEIEDTRISLVGRFGFGERGSIILIPSARYNGEKDSKSSDGRTYGLFAAAAWRLSPDLTIGPGIGVFSRIEDGTQVFPILVIDWNISERWNLSTGRGLASSQGPGLRLSYQSNERWSLGLAGRYENIEFRLDENGTTPSGVGRDQSIPLVASAVWEPNPTVKLSLFGGLEFGGKLKLKDFSGEFISETKYDPAPIFGGTFELRF